MIAATLPWTIVHGKFAITMFRLAIALSVVLGAQSPTTIGALALAIAADTQAIPNRSIPLFKIVTTKRKGSQSSSEQSLEEFSAFFCLSSYCAYARTVFRLAVERSGIVVKDLLASYAVFAYGSEIETEIQNQKWKWKSHRLK